MSNFGNIKKSNIQEVENPVNPDTNIDEDDGALDKRGSNLVNYRVFWFFVMMMMLLLLGRTFYLQGVRGSHYQEMAEKNRIRSLAIKAPRGIIRDKNGQVLARNIPSFDVNFIPLDLPDNRGERQELYEKVSRELDMNMENTRSIIEGTEEDSKNSYLLKEGINYERALVLMEEFQKIKGIYLDKTARRDYIDGPIFSHVVGYDGKITKEEREKHPDYLMTDYIGKNGLEYVYEKWLRGEHGEHRMEVDSSGDIKEDLGVINPVPGDELKLFLDADLQKKGHQVLSKILEENEEATGAALAAIDPRTGGVLSLVSLPSYDNNLFAKGISDKDYQSLLSDKKRPLLSRAISGEYPPGSTFKTIIAAAAVEEGVVDENTTIDCPGIISIGQWSFPDWKTHGITDIKKAIAESCNVFFYAIGGGWNNIAGLGVEKINAYAKLFGLGDRLGIDLPWESSGNIPDKGWKFKKFGEPWYVGDSYHFVIGQGFVTATPLQMANATAAIANGGRLFSPQVVDLIEKPNGAQEKIEPEIIRNQFIDTENIEIVREGMRQTVEGDSGSARQLSELEVKSAGKTGTAQFGNEGKTHSWYVSFAPYDNPEIAMAVLVEGGGEGHSYAVPAAKEILEWYFDKNSN